MPETSVMERQEGQENALEGEVMPSESDSLAAVQMTAQEYQKCKRTLRTIGTTFRATILAIYEGKGYRHDGYETWGDFCIAELGVSDDRGYQYLAAARTERRLRAKRSLAIPAASVPDNLSGYILEQISRIDDELLQERAWTQFVNDAKKTAEETTGDKANFAKFLKGDDAKRIVERILKESRGEDTDTTPAATEGGHTRGRREKTNGHTDEAKEAETLFSGETQSDDSAVMHKETDDSSDTHPNPVKQDTQEGVINFEDAELALDTLHAWIDNREVADSRETRLFVIGQLGVISRWIEESII